MAVHRRWGIEARRWPRGRRAALLALAAIVAFLATTANEWRGLAESWGQMQYRGPTPDLAMSVLFPKSYMEKSGLPAWHQKEPALTAEVVARDVAVIGVFALAGFCVSYLPYCKQRFMCAPHIDDFVPRAPSPSEGAMLAAALYGSNVAYNVLNKRVLLAHKAPLTVTAINFGTCSLCCMMMWMLRLAGPPPRLTKRTAVRLLPLVCLHWMCIAFANISVCEVNIAFVHTIKSAEPFITALLMMTTSRIPLRSWVSLLLVVLGVGVAAKTEADFTYLGFWSAMISNVAVALRTVLSKSFMDDMMRDMEASGTASHLAPLNFIAMLHCGAFVLGMPIALSVEGESIGMLVDHASYVVLIVGMLVWFFNCASILILSRTSPVTHSMIRTFRRPVLVLASILAFGATVEPMNIVGISLALFGAWLYTRDGGIRPRKMDRQWSGTH